MRLPTLTLRGQTVHRRTAARFLASVAAGGVLAGLVLGYATDARADTMDDTFIQVLDQQGIDYPSVDTAIGAAYEVCLYLAAGHSVRDAKAYVYQQSQLDARESAFFATAAAAAYCPRYLTGQAA